jgi:AraC family transcriptional regulator
VGDNLMESSLPAPVIEFQPDILMCESVGMYISLPKDDFTFFTRGSHKHQGYEFMLPITDMPLVEIDNKDVYARKYHVIPINPMQEHGVSGRMENVRFINILFDEDFFNRIIGDAFKQKNLLFRNENYPVSMELYSLIKIFIKESTMNSPERRIMLQNLSHTIAILIFRDIKKESNLFLLGKPFNAVTIKIKKVVDYIKENYQKECSLEELSEIAGISRFYLIRAFKDYLGKTPYDYLLDIRIENAKQLLTKGNMSITDICHECGFNNMSHFIRTFKKKAGITPSIYKNFTK